MVPKVGVEPTRPRGRQILSLVRLPFRHFGNLYNHAPAVTYPTDGLYFFPYYTIVTVKIKSKAEENAFFFNFCRWNLLLFRSFPWWNVPEQRG